MAAKNHVFHYFLQGVELVKYEVCFSGKFYEWLVMLSEYTFYP